ncbi:MAG: hypothetical protein ACYCY5_11400, partial [Sulfuricella sp.]
MILNPAVARSQPFDTPAMRAAQGERTTYHYGEHYKKPFVLSLSKHEERVTSASEKCETVQRETSSQ